MVYLYRETDENGYYRARIEETDSIQPEKIQSIYGVFKSRKQCITYLEGVCDQFQLCKKLLNIEKAKTSCFRYKLDLCKGVCISKEPALFYNMRFDQAFAALKINRWPFPCPIAITESDYQSGVSETFVIDQWCHLASILVKDEVEQERNVFEKYFFDYDVYKILNNYLKQANLKTLKLLPNFSYKDITVM
ncbi:MAG TPA: hypothetical protein VLI92_01115 [Candidatus Saccharimonadales bacterium]|nr:hypothetical protein [Candidatus Saccharimonadales bacterium]